MKLLEVSGLKVRFWTSDREVQAVKGLNFHLDAGEILGIVGESGSGKSQSALSILGLLADNGTASGTVNFCGQNLLALPEAELRKIRGKRISMVFQDPMTSLNPYLTIAGQMTQVLRQHKKLSKVAAQEHCVEMLEAVKIPDARKCFDRYPHELSGGMRQRVMIASCLLLSPDILIADEPTTALDVTVQAQIIRLMQDINERFGTAIIFITHDLGVVAGLCERVLVMHEGDLMEEGTTRKIFYQPKNAYTKALLEAAPRPHQQVTPFIQRDSETTGQGQDETSPLLDVHNLRVHFSVKNPERWSSKLLLKAVDGVSLSLQSGETLGVVGESGCGKSTLARAILRLVPATSGRVCLLGKTLTDLAEPKLRPLRKEMTIIFQDPLASLNPRMTVGSIVSEPLWTHRPDLSRQAVKREVVEVLQRVGLGNEGLNRYPHEFSGGQCQRIGIARALILKPRLIICDEPVSALDVPIQNQIMRLLADLQREFGLSLIFIAHDLAVVRNISHRIAVMYLGQIVEVAPALDLYERPLHPYTSALISAVPVPDPDTERKRKKQLLSGDLPSPINPPSGCRFQTRCRYAEQRCRTEVPELRRISQTLVACHKAEELSTGRPTRGTH